LKARQDLVPFGLASVTDLFDVEQVFLGSDMPSWAPSAFCRVVGALEEHRSRSGS